MAGAAAANSAIRMPDVDCFIDSGRVEPTRIDSLMRILDEHRHCLESGTDDGRSAGRTVMGLPLPDCQRSPSWSRERQIAFIGALWRGDDVGRYMLNTGDGAVLDGVNRLAAIETYLDGGFPVPDDAGTPRYWHDLPARERRVFAGIGFPHLAVDCRDQHAMAAICRRYDRGTLAATQPADAPDATPSP